LSGNNCCVQNNTNNKKQIKPMPHFTWASFPHFSDAEGNVII
jgi:hypothetical protein